MRFGAAAAACAFLLACTSEAPPVPGGTDLTIADGLASPYDLLWDGESWVVVYGHLPQGTTPEDAGPDALVYARLDAAGGVIDPPRIVFDLELDASDLRITAAPDGYLVWYRRSGSVSEIFTLALDRSGDVRGTPTKIADALAFNTPLALASDGASYGVMFVSDTSPDDDVSFQRVSLDGQPVGVPVVVEGRTVDQNDPAIAATATAGRFTSVWLEGTRVFSGMLDADGAVVTAGTRVLDAERNVRPRVATVDDRAFLVGALDTGFDTLRLYYVRDGASVWPEPLVAFPENRDERLGWDFVVAGTTATFALQSDADEAVPQIVLAPFDLTTATAGLGRRVTNRRFSWGRPVLAEGDGRIGLLFAGVVKGSVRIYFLPATL